MIIVNYLIVCLIFGTTFLAIKIGVEAALPPFYSAGIRFLAAGIILFFWMVAKKKAHISMLLRKEMLLTGAGLTFATFSTLYWAEQYVSSGIAAVLSATGPIIMLILQGFVMRQNITYSSILGCTVGFAGVVVIMVSKVVLTANLWWVIGGIAILLGEFFYASTALYSKTVIRRYSQDSPVSLNAVQMMYGGLLLLVLALFTEHLNITSVMTTRAIGSLLYLIVIGSMVGHTLFYWLVSKTNPIFPATWLYVSPPIAILVGVCIYGETINWYTGLGVLAVITGTILANWESVKLAWGGSQSRTHTAHDTQFD